MEEMLPYIQHMPGLVAKNLLLRDKKKNLWLLTAGHDSVVNLTELGKKLGAPGGLHMADETALPTVLGVGRGCVTPLALINDTSNAVKCVVDSRLLDSQHERVYFHPLVNSATTGLSPADFKKFLEAIGHQPIIVDLKVTSDAGH